MNNDLEFKQDRYFQRIYSSKMRVSRRVLRVEKEVAKALSGYLIDLECSEIACLASEFEWFFSWKFKTGCAPELLWCDGVESIKLQRVGKYSFQIHANLWIGPESNTEKLSKEKVEGLMVLRPSGKQFKSYTFKVSYGDSEFIARKT